MNRNLAATARLAKHVLLLVSCVACTACVSHEPNALIPAVGMSPEDFAAGTGQAEAQESGVDFGLEGTLNESDSLSNITVLPGVRVRTVRAGGPAALAGIQIGDVILSVDNIQTDHPDALTRIALSTETRQEFEFEVRRNTTVFATTVVAVPLAQGAPRLEELYRADPVASRAGYRTELVNRSAQPQVTAAQVIRLFPESPLPAHDVRIGDLIIALNGQPVASAQSLVTTLNQDHAPGDTVELTLVRDSEVLQRELTLWDPGRRVSKVTLGPLFRYEASLDPDRTQVTVLDLWLFSLFSYTREGQEKDYSLLGLLNFSSGLEGELATE